MPLTYKIDVVGELTRRGYTAKVLTSRKIMSQCVVQALRDGNPVSMRTLGIICELLHCDPGDILIVVDGLGVAADGQIYPPEHRHVPKAEQEPLELVG